MINCGADERRRRLEVAEPLFSPTVVGENANESSDRVRRPTDGNNPPTSQNHLTFRPFSDTLLRDIWKGRYCDDACDCVL